MVQTAQVQLLALLVQPTQAVEAAVAVLNNHQFYALTAEPVVLESSL